ncbi:MAG: hypothetical protein WD824_24290, partial [Cyclobacteriaceae bacterium]
MRYFIYNRPAYSFYRILYLIFIIALTSCKAQKLAQVKAPEWVSPNHYRIALPISNAAEFPGSNGPAAVDINFAAKLAEANATGIFDKHTVEIVAYNALGLPVVFDETRSGYEKYLLPSRIETYYGNDRVTLSFVMPDRNYDYLAYFDTKLSGLGKPDRYHGLIGDGDRFTEGYKRREVNASGYDCFADFDGDGDQDLFKGGTEPYIHCFENAGNNHFIARGKLTSAGEVFVVPYDGVNRSWHSVSFYDW